MHVMFCISTDKKQCWSVLRTVTSTDLRVLLSAGKDGLCGSPTLPFASTPNDTTIVPTLGVLRSLLKNVPDHFFVSSTRFRTLFAIVRHWSTSRWPLLRYIHTVPDTLSLFAIRFNHRKTSYRPVLRDACTFPNTLLLSAFPSCSAGKCLLRLLLGYDPRLQTLLAILSSSVENVRVHVYVTFTLPRVHIYNFLVGNSNICFSQFIFGRVRVG